MANHGCINGTLDGAKYFPPIPAIGLYIAAASLVCMLLMLYDIVTGFRARQPWLPCKLFTLNSVTLALLSIAAKLPVDLTTPMPSPQDQLSKLSSTTMICISMGFLLPSLGVKHRSECFTNLAALAIFVVTVIVNICIQISTGVIVLFIAEHIVILGCMLILLMVLCYSYRDINIKKRSSDDFNKEKFKKGEKDMLSRLVSTYGYCYRSNPQLVLCLDPICVVNSIICITCSFVLVQASFRSLILKHLEFCSGVSDYGWSMSIIGIIQIFTVLVGTFAIISRCLIWFKYGKPEYWAHPMIVDVDSVIDNHPILGTVEDKYWKPFRNLYWHTFNSLNVWGLKFLVMVNSIYRMFTKSDLSSNSENWKERKVFEELKRHIDASIKSLDNLPQLLSKTRPSHQMHTMELKDPALPDQNGVEVSSLSIVLLVRIAEVSLPDLCGSLLIQSFKEANEIVHFIEKTINPKSYDKEKLIFAKAVWAGRDFSCLRDKILDASTGDQPQSDFDRAVVIITKLKDILPCDFVWRELGIIVDFINRKTYSSIDVLYNSVEQMFVDMLHALLAQLPNAIFKYLSNSTNEKYEERVKVAFKVICKIQPIKAQIQWSFPAGSNISCMGTSKDYAFDHIIEDAIKIARSNNDDVISQVV